MADPQPIQLSNVNNAWLREYADTQHDGDLSAALDSLITAMRLSLDRAYEPGIHTRDPQDPWAGIDDELEERNKHR